MPSLVVDASIVLGWSFANEGDELSEASLAFVERHGAIAPTLFAYEIANVLAQLVRRGRLDAERSNTIAAAIDALDIALRAPHGSVWRAGVFGLASRHALTVYDASYLQLALDAGALLATSDRALASAARSHGVAFTS